MSSTSLPGGHTPLPQRPFSRLVNVRTMGWHLLGDANFANHTARGLLETRSGGHVICLSYDELSGLVRLQCRLDGANPRTEHLKMLLELQGNTGLGRVVLAPESQAAIVQMSSLYQSGSPAKPLMEAMIKGLRTMLENHQLLSILGIN